MLMIGAVGLMACGKKSPSSEVSTEATTAESEETTASEEVSTVATEETEATTEAGKTTTEATIADKKDEKKKPVSATGVYNGHGTGHKDLLHLRSIGRPGKHADFIREEKISVKST